MAERYYQRQIESQNNVPGRSMVYASLAGVALTAPLLGMMGFSFLATLTLLVISSPLLLIISPLLVLVGLLFAFVLVGFAVAASMALAGLAALGWMYREITSYGVTEKLAEFGEKVKEQGKGWAGYLQQKVQANSSPAYTVPIDDLG